MHTLSLLQTWFERHTPFMHVSRTASLLAAVGALLRGNRLTLSGLGRSLAGSSRTKDTIKRIDRLLGNSHVHEERVSVYRALAHWLLVGVDRPVIIVDWSDCEPGHEWLMLTAALAQRGRAISVYSEVHRLSTYNSPRAHTRFLQTLYEVLPAGCRPIIITDAGFRGPWFRAVEQRGWDWVGRVRHRIKVQVASEAHWCYTTAIYRKATHRLQALGRCWLSHKHPYAAHLYLVKVSRRSRGRPVKRHGAGPTATRCRKLYKDPWLLATSLPPAQTNGSGVMKLYALRMQIEETFRDLKDDRWSFGLALARSQSRARREVLLLIGALATLQLWLVGLAARARGWMSHFQANTERRRAVLSVTFLGREVLKHPSYSLTYADLASALAWLQNEFRIQAEPT